MHPSFYPLLALASPLALLAVALLAWRRPGARPTAVRRLGAAASFFGLLVAAGCGALVAAQGSLATPLLGVGGVGLSIRLDPLAVVMLGMVALLAVVIFRFSATYLEGDPRHGAFLGRLAATVASVSLLVVAGNLGLFFLAWVATSLTLHRLLLFYPERRGARIAARKKFLVARLGDLALLGAFALLVERFGTGELGALFEAAAGAAPGPALTGATLLIAFAALLKSAQFPTHGWLLEVVETPTPVSALLHAGILNAGPFLVVRYAALMELGGAAQALLVVVGGFTALFASSALTTQPRVKVALGYSSAAHMGFMLMVCGLGAYAAAILHLVAHSFYKAHAFLSSGSAVEQASAARVPGPRRTRSAVRIALGIGLALAVYAGLGLALGVSLDTDPTTLAIGAILVMGLAQLLTPALDGTGGLPVALAAAVMALSVALAFFGLEAGTAALLHTALPDRGPRDALTLGLTVGVLGAFGLAVLA
ncbi:MAG TPA: proton-conducting transporter membrane subunit, partial [Polyangiaceae bacterium LLY-WYZ-15_(1-7)]|nr:proton-conducting transporter membrane subunit [Polyangiaceae bacterium LLY-WYZ-15_(1-7)]